MYTTRYSTTPTHVRLDRDPDDGLLWVALGALASLGVTVLLTCWRAPILALIVASLGLGVWACVVGHSTATAAGCLAVVALLLLLAWVRPTWGRLLLDVLMGEALRVFVYRRRWETACLTAHATTRAGSLVHVPGLVRHRHRRGVDELTVRMAPGQTVAGWREACPALASTFGAFSATASQGRRAGWVRLDVQRCDPLGIERASADPARAAAGGLIELGRDEYGQPVTIDPTATAHVGLQGATRSGKSSTCYTLLGALAHRADVAVVGIDPSGLLLGVFEAGPNAAFIATGTRADDLDHAADALGRLVAVMDQRITVLRTSGVDKMSVFGSTSPAIWCVLEEYPGLLSAARALDLERGTKTGARLAPRIERAVGRLVKEGAKAGICVDVLAQRMSADALATDDRANLAVRITLRVDNGDAVVMLHDGMTRAGIDAVRQFAPGVGLVESPGHPLRRVRFHRTDYATYRARVQAGQARHAARIDTGDVIPGRVLHVTPAPAGGSAGDERLDGAA